MAMRLGLMIIVLCSAISTLAADIPANTDAELQAALKAAKPGDHIRLSQGPYKGGFYMENNKGTAEAPIRISGPSPEKPAVFKDDARGILMGVSVQYLEIENIHITRSAGHGLQFDEGGKKDFSCHHITVRHVRIDNIGPKTGICSIKVAGVSDFTVVDSTFEKWGDGGLAVDGVGCRNCTVERCLFLPDNGCAVMFKGGSEDVMIRNCVFNDSGDRAINVGGSTGIPYFRPKPQGFEARNTTIEGNVFIGTNSPVAFPNTDGAVMRFNTIYVPKRWAFRILQETVRDDFTPSRNVRIEDNIIAFKSKQWLDGGINIGPKTAPQTFTFARNAWFCVDDAARSTPQLPTAETDALIGRDPQFVDPSKHDFSLQPGSPAIGKGHTGLKVKK